MDRRKRTARTVALMSLFSMTDTQENVPVASFVGDGSDLVSLIVGIEPIQAGSGDPSPANVRPISGWTGVSVWDTGVNLFDKKTITDNAYVNGAGVVISSTEFFCSDYISVKPETAYYIFTDINGRMDTIRFYDANKTAIGGSAYQKRVVTTPAKCAYIRINAIKSHVSADEVFFNYPSTDTEYHAYQGETYSINFPSSAGTVYGGTLDVTTGKLTVDRANIASYNGETLTGRWISDRDVYSAGTTPTIGAQVVYELATPIVYDLTPTEINTLIGTNNIWADTGEIKYIEYNV